MDVAVGRAANWLQIAGAPSDFITIGTTVYDIIKDYRENLPLAAKQAQERMRHAETLLQRLEPVISSGAALQIDLTEWKTKLNDASAAVREHNDDPSRWTAPPAVDALNGVIADVNDLLDDISRTLLVEAHVHWRQNEEATILERRLDQALEFHSRRTTAGFNVLVESAASGTRSSRFRPLELDDDVSNRGDESSTSGGDRAAARRGGYRVNEGAKLRFTINCQFPENRYFFFITVDRSSEDKLQLYFPEFVADKNLLLPSSFDRVFPDEKLDQPYWPMTLACTGHNPYESITMYLVVTTQVLQKSTLRVHVKSAFYLASFVSPSLCSLIDSDVSLHCAASPAEERIKLGDVAHHVLNAGDNIIVNRFDFDVKNFKS